MGRSARNSHRSIYDPSIESAGVVGNGEPQHDDPLGNSTASEPKNLLDDDYDHYQTNNRSAARLASARGILDDVREVSMDDDHNEGPSTYGRNDVYGESAYDANDNRNNDGPVDANIHKMNRSRAGPTQVLCCATLFLGAVISFIVVTALFFQQGRMQSQTSESSMSLVPPPAELATLCDTTTIQNDQNKYDDCLQACAPSDCCNYPAGLDLSCLQGNEDECMSYHASCSALLSKGASSNSTIKPAPDEVATVCSPDNLATNVGIRLCAKYCLSVECCWEQGVASCTDNPNCAGYSPCLHLRAADDIAQSANEIVAEKCASAALSSSEGIADCQNVCEPAQCCFDTADCPYAPDPDFCDQYNGCGVLYDGTVSESALSPNPFPSDPPVLAAEETTATFPNAPPPLPVGIDVACDPSFLTDDSHFNKCIDDCTGLECCNLPIGHNMSCLLNYRKQCYTFQRYCAVLDGSVVADLSPDAVQDVDQKSVEDACSMNSLSTVAGYQECESYCNASDCCWSEDVDVHCRDNKICEKYSSCLNYKALTHVNPAIKDAVSALCVEDRVVTPTGRAMCDQLCSQHKCCYNATTGTACPFEDPAVCEQYTSCSVLNAPVQGYAPAPEYPADLAEKCYDLSDAAGQDECANACETADCCNIPENLPTSCLKGNHEVCINFHSACSALAYGVKQNETINIPAARDRIADVCSPRSLATAKGHRRCVRLCTPGRCCYSKLLKQGQLPCTRSQEEKCVGYASCLNLETGAFADAQAAVVQQVQNQCTETSIQNAEGRAICQAICTQHSCCWATRQSHITGVNDDDGFDDDFFDDDDDNQGGNKRRLQLNDDLVDDGLGDDDDDDVNQVDDDDDQYEDDNNEFDDDDDAYDTTEDEKDSSVPDCANQTVCALFEGCKLLNPILN